MELFRLHLTRIAAQGKCDTTTTISDRAVARGCLLRNQFCRGGGVSRNNSTASSTPLVVSKLNLSRSLRISLKIPIFFL